MLSKFRMDFVLDDPDLDLDFVGDFSSHLDLAAEEFEEGFLGGVGSLASFSLLSWEESELESLLEGLGLGLRFPFFLPSLASLLPFSVSLPRNFAMGDPSEEPWDGFFRLHPVCFGVLGSVRGGRVASIASVAARRLEMGVVVERGASLMLVDTSLGGVFRWLLVEFSHFRLG